MLNLESLNGKKFNFTVEEGKKLEYMKLADVDFKEAIVRSLYINRGGLYGDSATAVVTYLKDDGSIKTIGVNLPKHQLKNVESILDDEETVDAINSKNLSIKPRKYHAKSYNKDAYTVEWAWTSKELKKEVSDEELPF